MNTSGMWNQQQIMPEHDDSWEVRAFEEDMTAGSLLGCTWPPRSYTCAFCRREFRSAQALGGHMNVHRRERARLQLQTPPPPPPPPPPLPIKPPNGLCCLIYALPNNPNSTKTEPEELDLELRLGQRPPPPP